MGIGLKVAKKRFFSVSTPAALLWITTLAFSAGSRVIGAGDLLTTPRNVLYMQVRYEGVELLAVAPKSFADKEGDTVEYNECYFRHELEDSTPEVIVLNSRQDFTKSIGKEGTLVVDISTNRAAKPRLVSFEV